jgi:hypothetical protein
MAKPSRRLVPVDPGESHAGGLPLGLGGGASTHQARPPAEASQHGTGHPTRTFTAETAPALLAAVAPPAVLTYSFVVPRSLAQSGLAAIIARILPTTASGAAYSGCEHMTASGEAPRVAL